MYGVNSSNLAISRWVKIEASESTKAAREREREREREPGIYPSSKKQKKTKDKR